jgi:hypothetical protein
LGQITLNDLIASFGHLKRESLLSSWRWLMGDGKFPVLLTVMGDAFVQDTEDGSVHLLSVGPATIERVADSFDEFREILSDRDFVMEHLVPGLVVDLRARGCVLAPGQLYGFKVPPILGGEYVLENLERTDIAVHFELTGKIYETARNIPTGTPIKSIEIAD